MIKPEVIDAMVAAGCTAEQIAAVVKADIRAGDELRAKKREQNRIRQQNHRARNAVSRVTVRDSALPPSPDKEGFPHTPSQETNPTLFPPSPPIGGLSPHSKPTPRTELLAVLDAERADAVLDHRQRIRKPLSAHAAKLLARKFLRCPDPNAAADAMIANGWQGFEPEWLDNRAVAHGSRGPPAPGKRMMADVTGDLLRRMRNGNGNQHTGPSIDAGADGGGSGTAAPALRLAADAGRAR